MEFIETDIFTHAIQRFLTEEQYSFLQEDLMRKPLAGDLIPGGKGLRKLRWGLRGKGKRGGIRVIYYVYIPGDQIYMIYVYSKSKQTDLDPQQLKRLADYVKGGLL